ncbi:hypothetical protein QEJ31_14080 [Pigmentibacter sp. JX0631]|uniref:hypothetical protein n=1 Tax=Pigmentibacter sp. JX0631 TaxID=2976982 RepID=UPI002468B7CA|nr:hypothetical protein [Pigmentibacter sp. JX0631]WGL59656.1 hypothetical protein QEJ31_14080 [Pigmentibacter sp. JX0631]
MSTIIETLGKNGETKSSIFYVKENIIKPEEFISEVKLFLAKQNSYLDEFILILQHNFYAPWRQEEEKICIYYLFERERENSSYYVSSIYPSNVFYTFNEGSVESSKKGKLLQICKVTITEFEEKKLFKELKQNIFIKNKNNCFQPDNLFKFIPINILKPWGQEIWFTGVEKRGVAKVIPVDGDISIPIPWIFQALPSTLLGKQFEERQLILVKILEPISEKVYGDLYYELHTEKNEVYVVTKINSPSGKIKYGVNPEKLKTYTSKSVFKKELLTVIKEYENIRKKIDAYFDNFRIAEGISLNEPILPNKIKEWQKKIPLEDVNEEEEKRKKMDSFAGYLDLDLADVIQVPILVPHALQHGVTVVEFQTPTYERLILSFAQKVLTQENWDTDKAVDIMQLATPQKTNLKILSKDEVYTEEVVCHFNEFRASRITLEANKNVNLPTIEFYKILFHLSGKLIINVSKLNGEKIRHEIAPGECIFIPANLEFSLQASNEKCILLMCIPN